MLAQHVARPGERESRGFVARQQERDRLIPKLLVRHGPASLVPCLHQPRKEITSIVQSRPMLVEDSADDPFNGAQRTAVSDMTWKRHAVRNDKRSGEAR